MPKGIKSVITISIKSEAEYSWRKLGNWKSRYSKLYSTTNISLQKTEDVSRISFMSNDSDPYATLVQRMRSIDLKNTSPPVGKLSSFVSALTEMYDLRRNSEQFQDLGVHDTMLLNLVRSQSADIQELQDKTIELPKENDEESDDETIEPCTHGLGIRMTDRSVSRSRFSRVSTRRDMDIPSILAYNPAIPAPEPQLGIPAFQKVPTVQPEELPKWSIRRSVCPVCSQKWKDRSFLKKIRYSGLKRNSSFEYRIPSVMAPARLKTSIAREFSPRPLPSELNELSASRSSFRNSSRSWQLVRARRLRVPKSLMPSIDEETSYAMRTRKELEQRVKKFLLEE
ncbi:uncharacterized protein [Battus philenor]|uniref:uncharacterized protein n=1 Tax=Battus philenor TaxID=42288 RepID=UPI0035CF73C2